MKRKKIKEKKMMKKSKKMRKKPQPKVKQPRRVSQKRRQRLPKSQAVSRRASLRTRRREMMVLMVGVRITTTIMKEERAAAWTKFGWISSGHNVQLMPIYKTNVQIT